MTDRSVAGKRPDVILFIADDQRADSFQYMPNATSLIADQGVEFADATAHAALCAPSRATILTGLYVRHHGITGNVDAAAKFLAGPHADQTFLVWLQASGYEVGYFGRKMLNDDTEAGITSWPGVDKFETGLNGDASWQHAESFARGAPPSKPLLVGIAFTPPHYPARVKGPDVGAFSDVPPLRPPSFNAVGDGVARWYRDLPALTPARIDSVDAFHERQLEAMLAPDRGIARVLDAFADRGRPLVAVYVSDHGVGLGEARVDEAKNCAREFCVRIPFAVSAPGADVRVDTDSQVSLVDLAATLCDYAQASCPATDGHSFRPLVADRATIFPTATYHQTGQKAADSESVRTRRFTYTEYRTGERELFDRQADPYEMENVHGRAEYADEEAALAAQLRALKGAQ